MSAIRWLQVTPIPKRRIGYWVSHRGSWHNNDEREQYYDCKSLQYRKLALDTGYLIGVPDTIIVDANNNNLDSQKKTIFSSSPLSSPFFPVVFALLFSLPPSRDSDPGSPSRLFFSLPTTVRALQFYREKISALPSSTRVELCLPLLLLIGASRSFSLFFFANKFTISLRRDSSSRTNTTDVAVVVFEGR